MSEIHTSAKSQKPKMPKLSIVAIICSSLSVLSPYMGVIFALLMLLPYNLMTELDGPLSESWSDLIASVIILSSMLFMLFAPLLLCIASVLSWGASLIVIKRSKGKFCSHWLAFLWVFFSIAHIASIYMIIIIYGILSLFFSEEINNIIQAGLSMLYKD